MENSSSSNMSNGSEKGVSSIHDCDERKKKKKELGYCEGCNKAINDILDNISQC